MYKFTVFTYADKKEYFSFEYPSKAALEIMLQILNRLNKGLEEYKYYGTWEQL